MQELRIPEDRVNVLIGVDGATKKQIEKRTGCKLTIDDGDVMVEGESLNELIARDIVHAIGRGFNPEKALLLKNDDYIFDLIDISEWADTPKARMRMKGRIIGQEGRTRKILERSTGSMISVYGKTIGIIGGFDAVGKAKEAVIMLLNGSRHGTVYRFLQK